VDVLVGRTRGLLSEASKAPVGVGSLVGYVGYGGRGSSSRKGADDGAGDVRARICGKDGLAETGEKREIERERERERPRVESREAWRTGEPTPGRKPINKLTHSLSWGERDPPRSPCALATRRYVYVRAYIRTYVRTHTARPGSLHYIRPLGCLQPFCSRSPCVGLTRPPMPSIHPPPTPLPLFCTPSSAQNSEIATTVHPSIGSTRTVATVHRRMSPNYREHARATSI